MSLKEINAAVAELSVEELRELRLCLHAEALQRDPEFRAELETKIARAQEGSFVTLEALEAELVSAEAEG